MRIYDWLSAHRKWLWACMAAVIIPLAVLAASMRYNEDIMDFLPVGDDDRESLEIYRSLQSATRMVLIVEGDDKRQLTEAIDLCAELIPALITEVDIDGYVSRLQYVHSQMPYFLTETDYARLDSIFTPEAVRAALRRDKSIVSTPGTGFLSAALRSDPLGILPLTIGAQGQYGGAEAQSAFTSYDGYMMTADHRMAFAFYDSPFGSTETGSNAALVDSLNSVIDQVRGRLPQCRLRWLGSPVIAVGNARQIKTDTLMCIALSLVFIICLLAYYFPRRRDWLLILLAVAFGWLFGMAVLRMITPVVSGIVLGISGVLIGIAVNYPLHLLVHQRYTSSVRQTLKEVVSPLTVGNITTIGAFLTLVPLQATALRHLGIFAASMLIGTLFFCAIVMPHMLNPQPAKVREISLPRTFNVYSKWGGGLLMVITIALGICYLSNDNAIFDTKLGHINYMTRQQRDDFAFFGALSHSDDTVSDRRYLATAAREELAHRAVMWSNYWQSHDAVGVVDCIRTEAAQAGFKPEAFEPFYQVLTSWQPIEHLDTETLTALWPGRLDEDALNKNLTQGLSDNFDYIGAACSLIVFCFLWLSFRNFRLALIAFLPMAVSWIWILAIMKLLGLQFNVVNIILATFIFGQGDDYTIFVVEGLLYEHQTGKPILPQYRQSILLSALIMLHRRAGACQAPRHVLAWCGNTHWHDYCRAHEHYLAPAVVQALEALAARVVGAPAACVHPSTNDFLFTNLAN